MVLLSCQEWCLAAIAVADMQHGHVTVYNKKESVV